ncbi:hypothetical protein QYE76_031795 [Lolium multiflorum]|uniref:CCHC-type domain-containing protein n=1 Tax=Lolium multiflorum TaxID=4521 RepID=A0AAD8QSU3_LOLMU|nr:hypothetical protein QYE76_031795 [Lolium multiflorum]
MTSVLWYNNNHNNHLMKMAVSMVTMRMLLLLKAWDVVLVVVFHVASIAVMLNLVHAVFLHSRKMMVWQGVMTVDAYYMEMEMLMQRARVRESLEMTLQRFLNGLKFNIKGIVRHHSYTTMNELLHHAREAESQLAEEAQQRGRATGAGRYTPRPPPSTVSSTRPTDVPSSSSKPVSNVSNTKRPVPAASGTGSSISTARNRDMLCHTCGGKGHFKKDCPNRKVMIINEDNEYETGDDADPDAPEDDDYDSDSFDAYPSEAQTIVVSQRVLNVQPSASTQRCNLFQTKALVGPDKACKVIIDGGSCRNLASKELCAKLKLKYLPHPHPYYIQWLSNNGEMKVSHMVRVDFEIGPYKDSIDFDVVPMMEFSDVFPEEVPAGLPPLRGIENQIDLIPGASLPNRAPYRTNPEETKEIQKQVQALLDKGSYFARKHPEHQRAEGGPGGPDDMVARPGLGRATIWCGHPFDPLRRLFAYIKPLHRKPLKRKPRYEKSSRAAAVAKPRSGTGVSVPAPCRSGEVPRKASPSTPLPSPPPSSSPLLLP